MKDSVARLQHWVVWNRIRQSAWAWIAVACTHACTNSESSSEGLQRKRQRTVGIEVHAAVADAFDEAFHAAVEVYTQCSKLRNFAWDSQRDYETIVKMRSAWLQASLAQTRAEASREILLRNENVDSTDAFDFPSLFHTRPYSIASLIDIDVDPFDDQKFIGVLAVERILFADRILPELVAFETMLSGSAKPRFPQDDRESTRFCDMLVSTWVHEIEAGATHWKAERPERWSIDQQFDLGWHVWPSEVEFIDTIMSSKGIAIYSGTSVEHLRARLSFRAELLELQRPWFRVVPAGDVIFHEIELAQSQLDGFYDKIPMHHLPLALGEPTLNVEIAKERQNQARDILEQVNARTSIANFGSVRYLNEVLRNLLHGYFEAERMSSRTSGACGPSLGASKKFLRQ